MKLFTTVFAFCITLSVSAQRNCGTDNYWQQQTTSDPALLQRYQQINNAAAMRLKISKKEYGNDVTSQPVITIPVVVHVLYNTTNQNISEAQVQSQLDVLNKDFGKLNADIANVPTPFASVAADCKIRFQLATTDPNGNATS